MGYTTEAWVGFGEALAAIAGALTALLFVALSVKSDMLAASCSLSSRAGASTAGAAAAAAVLVPRLPGTRETEIAALAAMSSPGPLFAGSPFVIKGSYVQISPCDERCVAGQVAIGPGAEGPFMQISGELFTLRRRRS